MNTFDIAGIAIAGANESGYTVSEYSLARFKKLCEIIDDKIEFEEQDEGISFDVIEGNLVIEIASYLICTEDSDDPMYDVFESAESVTVYVDDSGIMILKIIFGWVFGSNE